MTTASIQQPRSPSLLRTPPTIGSFPLGILPEFRRDPLGLYLRALQQHRDIVRMRFGPRYSYALFHPEYIKHVLVDNHRNYVRNRMSNGLLKKMLGQTRLTAE